MNVDAGLLCEVKNKLDKMYEQYLLSPEWKKIRGERLKIDNFMCVICKSKDNLQVHHINYNDFDNLDNLRTLCKKCHEDIHSFREAVAESSKNGTLKEAMQKYDEEMTKIVDKYVLRREKTLNDNGDCYLMTNGNQKGMNRYIRALFEWQPYGNILWYGHGSYCGVNFTRYNKMRLERKQKIKTRKEETAKNS